MSRHKIIILFYYIIFINSEKIVFPFKEIETNNTLLEDDPGLLYNQIFLNNIYTKIKEGKSDQTIIASLNSEKSNIMFKDISKFYNIEGQNTYDYSLSKETFKNITAQNKEEIITKGYSIISETLKLSKDKNYNNYIEIKDFKLELFNNFDYNNKTKTLSGEIGFKDDNSKLSFIKQLLDKNIIKSNIISFNYISDNEGYIYLGDYLGKNNQKSINMANSFDGSLFQIDMDYIYIKYNNGRTFFTDTNIMFYLEQGVILASDGYQKSINEMFF